MCVPGGFVLHPVLPPTIHVYFFFFQAEDGIRDDLVTGVQTCALPIFQPSRRANGPVPCSTTPSINRRNVAAVSGRMTRLGSAAESDAGVGSTRSPRLICCTTCGLTSKPPLAMAETAVINWIGVTPISCPMETDPMEIALQLSSRCNIPLLSPGRSTPVGAPKPNARMYS